MSEIELGDKVKDIYTGFTGVATARTEFLNGCIQFNVAPKWDGKSTTIDEMGIDEQSLIVLKPKKKVVEKEETNGGQRRKATKMKGF